MMQKPKILAADNTKVALRYMETILGDIYDVTLVQTGMSVLDCLKSENSGFDSYECEYVWNGWLRSSPPDKRG